MTKGLTRGTVSTPHQGDSQSFAEAWSAVRADESIQFAPVPQPPPEPPPAWLEALGRFLAELFKPIAHMIGVSWPVFKWVLVALAVSLLALLVWRLVEPIIRIRKASSQDGDATEWVPEAAEAIALLEDADRLAAEGLYGEAAHLLLRRSVRQISDARPDLVGPSTTAREIASLPSVSERARNGFGIIAAQVERSLFAKIPLSRDDWQVARNAYSDFALADLVTAP